MLRYQCVDRTFAVADRRRRPVADGLAGRREPCLNCAQYAQASPSVGDRPCSPNVRCEGRSIVGCVNSGKCFLINVLIRLFPGCRHGRPGGDAAIAGRRPWRRMAGAVEGASCGCLSCGADCAARLPVGLQLRGMHAIEPGEPECPKGDCQHDLYCEKARVIGCLFRNERLEKPTRNSCVGRWRADQYARNPRSRLQMHVIRAELASARGPSASMTCSEGRFS
jgi:hypothetical protein